MEANVARTVVRLIFGVAVKDGRLTDAEIAFLARTRAKFGIPADQDAWAMPIADATMAAQQLAAMPAEVQEEALTLLVEAATLDGVVHDAERRFLETSAEAIGWTKERLEARIIERLSVTELGPEGAA
jgi:hypothetical protein